MVNKRVARKALKNDPPYEYINIATIAEKMIVPINHANNFSVILSIILFPLEPKSYKS